MRLIVAVDDTDNLETKGTGHLAARIIEGIEQNGWGRCSYITRHQLFVHPDVPYTSHNSAMVFTAEIGDEARVHDLVAYASAFLEQESAPGSDPGLCVAVEERLPSISDLVAYGRRAKQSVLTKDDAYRLARQLGVHLSEHGGTGGGVIGALAGVGLRLSGNDGRVRGRIEMGQAEGPASVGQICSNPRVDAVKTLDGSHPARDELVLIQEREKAVLLDGRSTLLVMPSGSEGARWRTCPKDIVRQY